jgi:hypothetical protein
MIGTNSKLLLAALVPSPEHRRVYRGRLWQEERWALPMIPTQDQALSKVRMRTLLSGARCPNP